MSKAKITVKLLSACNYDHDRIGTVIVGEEALDFRLERSGNLLVSNDSNRFVNIKDGLTQRDTNKNQRHH